jgi:hypothetical protein
LSPVVRTEVITEEIRGGERGRLKENDGGE